MLLQPSTALCRRSLFKLKQLNHLKDVEVTLPSNLLDFAVPSLQVVVDPGSIFHEHIPRGELKLSIQRLQRITWFHICYYTQMKRKNSTSNKVITLLDETRLDETGVDENEY